MNSTPDLVIRNGWIVDGSGAPGFSGDVAIDGDRITAVGGVRARGRREIDVQGAAIAPGFIDVHTHYDPQLCWDGTASPSPEHGVTSIVIGNCSVGLAPVRPADTDTLVRWFSAVEDMEGELLKETVPFSWESVSEYLAKLKGAVGPNVGALMGHAVLRYYVMGRAAQERTATSDEVGEMARLAREAFAAGAFGLSFTFNHLDDRGRELPCMFADRAELKALVAEVAAARRIAEVSPNFREGCDPLEHTALFGALALETGATCSISPLIHNPGRGDEWRRILDEIIAWRAKGARLFGQTQVRPLDISIVLAKGSMMLSKTPLWRRVMDQPLAGKRAMLADPQLRAELVAEMDANNRVPRFTVKSAPDAASQAYVGRTLDEIARAHGTRPIEELIDIANAGQLESEFALTGFMHADASVVGDLLDHEAMHIGSGDAGAHLSAFAGAGDSSYLLHHFVREQGRFTLERAVKRLTSDLAEGWRIAERGRLQEGYFADVVVFDPDAVVWNAETWVHDLPCQQGRYTRAATGIDFVIVNGSVLVERGKYKDARSGYLL